VAGLARVLQPKPLIVAAIVGAVGYWGLRRFTRFRDIGLGAALGVAVQVGVRLAGVS
jgi:hypothetical protein